MTALTLALFASLHADPAGAESRDRSDIANTAHAVVMQAAQPKVQRTAQTSTRTTTRTTTGATARATVQVARTEQARPIPQDRPASKPTTVAAVRTETATAIGFTASAGTTSVTIVAVPAAAGTSRRGDPSLPTGGVVAAPKSQPKAEASAQVRSQAGGQSSGLTRKAYYAHIERHAKANGIPVALALAVVRYESNFNAKARGRAGEVGLMQIKPQTARGVGFSGSAAALYDPDTNLRYGMKYLAGAYRLAGGDTCGTILRYQGGHYAKRMTKAASAYCARVKSHMKGQWT